MSLTRQQGFSLLELLIVVFLSSILLVGVTNLMLGQQLLYKTTLERTRQLSDLHHAFNVLTTFVAQSGNEGNYFYLGSCGSDGNCTYSDERTNTSQIAIIQPTYIGRDCTRQQSHINIGDTIANVFWIADNNHGSKSLFCRGFNITQNAWVTNGRSIALVDNINRLEFLLLEQFNDGVLTYQMPQSVEDWGAIKAVKLSIENDYHRYQTTVAMINASTIFQPAN